ncbi:MAG: TlpA disulfide reductase family protein [Propionicimonas sp.]|uniref:TlpA family protein disulfide reductase n=1 Tax=Propionicimonas sp. TaxID=1955623 RepID=UPI002B20B0FF|nr:TlpA disulfide reductase family protein [Propionicimonas sp.]MEA4945802.1 TlpA disulfide reductase family protein [Propionicimonas sp.]MEA5052241.1 TlpA disulfide reductase family protein [Propionicimonas sp.]MEA5119636.1 TlpA disulfide reductase family protein [Propionicimonas sp.]
MIRRWGLVAAAILLAGCSAVPVPSPSPSVDLVAARRAAGIADCPAVTAPAVPGGLPEIELDCLGSDSTVKLSSLRGPLVLNLWAQWCPPCRKEAPVLAQFQSARPDVALIGLDYDDPQPDWAIEFAQLSGWTYPHLVDPDKTTTDPLAVLGIPFSILVDAEGRVVARQAGGFTSLAELEEWVDQGLAS